MNHHERIVILATLQLAHRIDRKLNLIMPTLDDIQNDVANESTLIDGVSTLIAGLKQQITDLLASEGVHPDTQAKLDAIFAQVEANKQNLAAALAVAPVPEPTPEPTPAPDPAPTPDADQPTA